MLGLALGIGSLLASGATAAWLAGASMVVGVYTAREQRRKAERDARRSIKDRTVMVREAVTDRPYAYGRVRLSGQVQFPGSAGQYNERLHFALALGDRFDAIEEVWFGDRNIGPLDSNGWPTAGSPYYTARTLPEYATATVNASRQITLPHTPAAILAVAAPVTGDTDSSGFYVGNPTTDQLAYSISGNVLTFHANRVGMALVVSYTHTVADPKARAKAFLGEPGQQAWVYWINDLPSNWTANDRFTGTSYIAGTLFYDQDLYPTGIPEVSAVARAQLCFDPRTGQTAWTRNPALIARDYILRRFPNEQFDAASVIAAANACDEAVPISGSETQPRYTFDDVISSDTGHIEGLQHILQAMVGSAVRASGTWYLWAGVWEEPTIALDEDDLGEGAITVQGNAEDGVIFNGVSGTYTDPATWVEDSFPTYVSPTYVAADNGNVEILPMPLTQIIDIHRVQRVRNLLLHKSRQALTFSCTMGLSGLDVVPGRMVTWTLARYGWVDKAFRCIKWRYRPADSLIDCAFQEDAPEIYGWDYDEATNPDPSPNTNLPDPRFVEVPVLTFASGSQFATTLADGSQRPYLRVYWQPFDASVDQIELWWRRAGETTWQQQKVPVEQDAFDIYGVSGSETYIVIGRAINGIGVRSAWAAYSVAVDTSAPANGGNVTLGAGANLLPNATMANTASGWFAYMADGATLDVVDAPTAYPVGGVDYYAGRVFEGGAVFGHQHRVHPYNAIMLYAAAGGIGWYGALQNKYTHFRVPVKAGDRVEIQTRAASSDANAILHVQAFDANGAHIGELAPAGDRLLVASEGKTGNLTIDSLKWLWGFVDIPAGVASVSWMLECRRASASGAAFVSASMPYLGLAHIGQTEPTPWHPGPSGGAVEGLDAVNTAQILPEAATQVLFDSSSGGTMAAGPLTEYDGPGGAIVSIPITNTSDRDIELIATASGSLRCYFGGEDVPSYANVSLSTSNSPKTAFASQSVRVGETTSGSRHETYSLVNRAVLAPGWSGTVSLKITRVNKTDLGPTLYAQLDWHATTLRLELIKA